MLSDSNGKLMVYVSSLALCERRLEHVKAAVEKLAKMLKLGFEIVTLNEEFAPIYVYYKNGEEDAIPVYCDKNGKTDAQKVYEALRNMMFVLSFHPKHSALKEIRKEIMVFS